MGKTNENADLGKNPTEQNEVLAERIGEVMALRLSNPKGKLKFEVEHAAIDFALDLNKAKAWTEKQVKKGSQLVFFFGPKGWSLFGAESDFDFSQDQINSHFSQEHLHNLWIFHQILATEGMGYSERYSQPVANAIIDFGLSPASMKLLKEADPRYWKLATDSHYDPLVFVRLFSTLEPNGEAEIFDAFFDYLSKRQKVMDLEPSAINQREAIEETLKKPVDLDSLMERPGMVLALQVNPLLDLAIERAIGESVVGKRGDWIQSKAKDGFNLIFIRGKGQWHLASNPNGFPTDKILRFYNEMNLSDLYQFNNSDLEAQRHKLRSIQGPSH